MNKPNIGKYPTEIFGHYFESNTPEFKDSLDKQYCHFICDTCKKPRKSEPETKVGICSVGYKCGPLNNYEPVIICPHRFLESVVFRTVEDLYLKDWENIKWVSEVGIGVGGNVDYVAFNQDHSTNEITDFLCVEFQAGGTTGSPWPAVVDLKQNGKYQSSSYNFGINWANEFMKTMMQQVYKKGKIVKHWNRKIIFIIQDVAMDYLHNAVDTTDLRQANSQDEIHFLTFSMKWINGRWNLSFKEALSTDLEGVNKILGGANKEDYPTEATFINSILNKQKQSK